MQLPVAPKFSSITVKFETKDEVTDGGVVVSGGAVILGVVILGVVTKAALVVPLEILAVAVLLPESLEPPPLQLNSTNENMKYDSRIFMLFYLLY
jgi:hypothetical protein